MTLRLLNNNTNSGNSSANFDASFPGISIDGEAQRKQFAARPEISQPIKALGDIDFG